MPNQAMHLYTGVKLYENATTRAFWQEIIGHLRGKPARLLSFDEVRTRLRLREESYKGLKTVPLDAIVGSVGRYKDFTGTFLPKEAISKERWSHIYAETVGPMGLPPIEVYQMGEVYFVRDGNHRVSVARALGNKDVQAYVTELETPICLNRDLLVNEMDAMEAYMRFLDESCLRAVRPHHASLMLSEPSRYDELLAHLHLHQAVIQGDAPESISLEKAAAHWYDTVYRPVVTMIRKYDMLAAVKGRTEADLYLWMVNHLREIEWCYTGEHQDFNPALAAFLQEHRLPVPDELLQAAG